MFQLFLTKDKKVKATTTATTTTTATAAAGATTATTTTTTATTTAEKELKAEIYFNAYIIQTILLRFSLKLFQFLNVWHSSRELKKRF